MAEMVHDSGSDTELETTSASASEDDFELIQSAQPRKRKASVQEHLDHSIDRMRKMTRKKTDVWCLALQLTLKKLPPKVREDMKVTITNLFDIRYSSRQHQSEDDTDYDAKLLAHANAKLNKLKPELKDSAVQTSSMQLRPSCGVGDPAILWHGAVNMIGEVTFTAKLTAVHGGTAHLKFPFEMDIAGRITPETVYEYIAKVKRSNELVLLRFSPATKEDTDAYKYFIDYLHSRHRFGVIVTKCQLIKDFYVLPLIVGQTLPATLMPKNKEANIVANDTDLLFGVIVKNHLTPK